MCYPFHPATIASVFDRYSSVARKEETSYQNSRGALYLLAHLLQETLPPSGECTGKLLIFPKPWYNPPSLCHKPEPLLRSQSVQIRVQPSVA